MIVSRGGRRGFVKRTGALARSLAGCSCVRRNMGLDRGIHTHTHHTRELFLLPLSLSLSLSSWRSQYSPSMQSFAPLCHSLRARFWSCSRPDRSAPFTRTFPLLSPLLQPSNYITLLAFAPTGPSKGVAAKYALRSGSRGWPACIGLARPPGANSSEKKLRKKARPFAVCLCDQARGRSP
jgi:hypothetical protein